MPFAPGTPKPEGSGRRKGTPNKLSREVSAKLEEMGVDPIEGLARIAKDRNNPLDIRVRAYKELAEYCYPKRRRVEHILQQEQETATLRDAILATVGELPEEIRIVIAGKLLELDTPNGKVQ